jgi:hypothetical protein
MYPHDNRRHFRRGLLTGLAVAGAVVALFVAGENRAGPRYYPVSADIARGQRLEMMCRTESLVIEKAAAPSPHVAPQAPKIAEPPVKLSPNGLPAPVPPPVKK